MAAKVQPFFDMTKEFWKKSMKYTKIPLKRASRWLEGEGLAAV